MQLPTGTVTFLFTDIEGSTRRWEEQRAAMAEALTQHDRIVRHAIESHGGSVFKTVGDAFCAAFARPVDGVLAAISAQLALRAEDWAAFGADFAPLRVRMALHAGAADAAGGDYYGPPVNRVARLLSAGHGGQILVSGTLEGIVAGHLPDSVDLVDLGEHQLSGVARPLRVFQASTQGLPADFPPLRTPRPSVTNVPLPLTTFVGRERELAQLRALLQSSRLATITGVGGTGKTRLALEVASELAHEHPDGAWFVDLAPLTDGQLLVGALMDVLGLREEERQSAESTLLRWLRDRHTLIVLDNCEQVLDDCADLTARLLAACPSVRVLATSRAALHVPGEALLALQPLLLPDAAPADIAPSWLSAFGQCEAVRLFVDRAVAVRPDFAINPSNAPAVAQICQRLDGIPLAIELVAARVRILSPQEIDTRLAARLLVLGQGDRSTAPRHQTLHAALDWSYDLLDEPERRLFARLAVFRGGWTLTAAEEVCSGDGIEADDVLDLLAQLVDQSLVLVGDIDAGDGAETRYRMLETVGAYATERLMEAGEWAGSRDRHVAWVLDSVETYRPLVIGSQRARALKWFTDELNNLRAAHDWCLGDPGHADLALRLAWRTTRFWIATEMYSEGRAMAESALSANTSEPPTVNRAGALMAAGAMAQRRGDLQTAAAHQSAALEIHRTLDDPAAAASSLHNLATVLRRQGDYDRAATLLAESIAIKRQHGTAWQVATSLEALAIIRQDRGELAAARTLYEEALAAYRDAGDRHAAARALDNIGTVWLQLGAFAAARSAFEESLDTMRALASSRGVAYVLGHLAELAVDEGSLALARRHLDEALNAELQGDGGEHLAYLGVLEAEVLLGSGDAQAAAERIHAATSRADALGGSDLPWAIEVGAAIAAASGDWRRAGELLGAAAALREDLGTPARTPRLRAQNDRIRAGACDALGETGLAAATADGRRLSTSAALDLARGTSPAT